MMHVWQHLKIVLIFILISLILFKNKRIRNRSKIRLIFFHVFINVNWERSLTLNVSEHCFDDKWDFAVFVSFSTNEWSRIRWHRLQTIFEVSSSRVVSSKKCSHMIVFFSLSQYIRLIFLFFWFWWDSAHLVVIHHVKKISRLISSNIRQRVRFSWIFRESERSSTMISIELSSTLSM